MDYRYEHFGLELMREDSSFQHAPLPGNPAPDFELTTTEGNRLRKADFLGERLLLTFASFT